MDPKTYTCPLLLMQMNCECVAMHMHNCRGLSTWIAQVSVREHYLEAEAMLLSFSGFRGTGGGAVEGTAAASSRAELAALPKHFHLAICALWVKNKK